MRQGLVRIIAGKWRGRRLKVPDVKDLRPTPDRVRETLFNWLMPFLPEAHCLDLFAGSGVLGFEAASRGAAHVVMVDHSAAVVTLLKEEVQLLQADNIDVYRLQVPKQFPPRSVAFDIVFLDPPYQSDYLSICCQYLEEQNYLAKSAYIYLEAQEIIKDNDLPLTWRVIKCQQAGQVFFHLAHRELNINE